MFILITQTTFYFTGKCLNHEDKTEFSGNFWVEPATDIYVNNKIVYPKFGNGNFIIDASNPRKPVEVDFGYYNLVLDYTEFLGITGNESYTFISTNIADWEYNDLENRSMIYIIEHQEENKLYRDVLRSKSLFLDILLHNNIIYIPYYYIENQTRGMLHYSIKSDLSLELSNNCNFSDLGLFDLSYYDINDFKIDNDYAYILTNDNNMLVLNYTASSFIPENYKLYQNYNYDKIFFTYDHLIMGKGDNLSLFDYTNPYNLINEKNLTIPNMLDYYIKENYAYITTTEKFMILNINNIDEIIELDKANGKEFSKIYIEGSYAYISKNKITSIDSLDYKFFIFDISNPNRIKALYPAWQTVSFKGLIISLPIIILVAIVGGSILIVKKMKKNKLKGSK